MNPPNRTPDSSDPPPSAFVTTRWTQVLRARGASPEAQVALGELCEAGKADQFEALKPWLLGDVASLSQAEVAQRLSLSDGAIKVAIHRLRKRFRELVKTEIAQTVDGPAQVQEELRYLLEVLNS